jgi:hypothetical protein
MQHVERYCRMSLPKKFLVNQCFHEFTDEFSNELIPRFRDVFEFVKLHSDSEASGIRRLHLGYTAMREHAFDFITREYPWLEDFRCKMGLEKKLNFLETNGLDKSEFKPHIDGKPGNPAVMFNAPIQNCTDQTETYWVEPLEEMTPVLLCENGQSSERVRGATPHLPPQTPFRILQSHHFTNRCALFRSDIFHGAINRSKSADPRIMMHWWYPPQISWEIAVHQNHKYLLDGLDSKLTDVDVSRLI